MSSAEKCQSWHRNPWGDQCYGTKEMERCNCGGDRSKCDFYPEIRENAKTNTGIFTTGVMWVKAQNNGLSYYSGNVIYSAMTGMRDRRDGEEVPLSVFGDINSLMKTQWREYKTMTRESAEEILGVLIVD